ncbi:uncharacterized protein PAF06_011291 [Gastrophryne carolinensis]
MPRSKEISEDVKRRVIEAHKDGNGYKKISKDLGIHRSTVRQIIYKWKTFSTVSTLPRSGRPAKIGVLAHNTILKEVAKNPGVTVKDLQATLAHDNIHVHESTIRKTVNVSLIQKMREMQELLLIVTNYSFVVVLRNLTESSMPRSKEISEDLKRRVVEAHKEGNGYKRISKALGLHRSTIRHIVDKWKKFSTVSTLPRSGRPTKIGVRAHNTILKEVAKNPGVTVKDLQATLAQDNVHVHESTIRKTVKFVNKDMTKCL